MMIMMMHMHQRVESNRIRAPPQYFVPGAGPAVTEFWGSHGMEEGKGERYLASGRQYGNALLGVRHQEEGAHQATSPIPNNVAQINTWMPLFVLECI